MAVEVPGQSRKPVGLDYAILVQQDKDLTPGGFYAGVDAASESKIHWLADEVYLGETLSDQFG
jgi:hypothetical protein